jgi:murein DD-endopeptidase MepM/ murein hydrolase activator NlpD
VGVRGSLGRAGVGLVGIVVATLLASGVPASAAPVATPSASPTASPRSTPSATDNGAASSDPATTDPATTDPATTDPATTDGTGTATKPDAAVEAHDTAALTAATQALEQAQADLIAANADLTIAQAELAAAQAADAAAQVDLQTTAVAEQRAARDLAGVRDRVDLQQTDLGRLASASYRSAGMLGEWSLVLGSDTPNQLADRLATLQSVASAGNAMIAGLNRDRADLTNAEAHFTAMLDAQASARVEASRALLEKTATEKKAAQAEQQLALDVTARAAALAAAQHAATLDNVQYQTMIVQSGQLEQRITGMAAKLAAGKTPPQGTGHFDRPGRGFVTSPYGMRMHPILHYVKLHTGTDFSVADGISYAADDGVVLITEFNVAYGNMTVIDHGTVGGVHITTLYAHQSAFGVQPGDRVVKGQPIGVIGETGYATGPHLHFEVRIDGSPVDPGPFLVDSPPPPVLRGPARVAIGP